MFGFHRIAYNDTFYIEYSRVFAFITKILHRLMKLFTKSSHIYLYIKAASL